MARRDGRIPLREYRGKNPDGSIKVREAYLDPKRQSTTEAYYPRSKDGEELGWNGHPPDMPTGSAEKEGTEHQNRDLYREGWERIFGRNQT